MSTTSSKVFTKRVHVFTAGPQISAQGVERDFTPDDLQQVVESYDPQTHEAPLVIGHSGDNDSVPSFGWVKKLVRSGEKLYADVDFTDTAKDLVKDGHYRKVSISFYSPNSPINPHEGKWSVRHLALLGASPPAVKGLEPFSFSEDRDGVFNFASTLSPSEIFDEELGPTLLVERSPLEILKEKLEEVRGDMKSSLYDLQENQDEQTETDVDETQNNNSADSSTAPENPNQQFSEMKKKMGREGAEVSESAQKLANMEDQFPEEKFDEGVSRKVRKGAHGQEVQVVEEVFEEDDELSDEHGEVPAAFKKNMAKMKAKAKHKAHDEDMDEGEEEGDFAEVSDKTTSGGKASFGKHAQKDSEDPAGRSKTARSSDDSYGDRQSVGHGDEEDREGVTSDDEQDLDRVNTAKNGDQEEDRTKLAKVAEGEGDEDSRWADQPEGRRRAMEDDQYDDGKNGLPARNKPGISDGTDPHGRDGGPTPVSEQSEEEPDSEDIVVPLESTKGNIVSRVLHQTSGQKRAPLKGKEIADHSEESDGVTRTAKKAGVSSGNDPHGRDDGPTNFPSRSEEEPDDLEMAVDLENATQSNKVRILRQKSGDQPSLDHAEDDDLDVEECEATGKMTRKYSERDPMTRTGKGSTYGQKRSSMDDEDSEDDISVEDDDYSETDDFCGMGSMGQAKPMGYPVQMFEEFQRELENLKNENSRLKKEYQEQQTRSRKQRIAEFVDNLYTEGKLTDGIIPQRDLQNYCEGLEFGTLEFAEGESPTTKLFGLLDRLPNLVYFGEVVAEGRFEEPEDEDLDPHARAMKMVEAGECDYVEAIKRCIPWGGRG
jgi:hypothetical protein